MTLLAIAKATIASEYRCKLPYNETVPHDNFIGDLEAWLLPTGL
jgi:hypothetical protein